MRTVQSIANPSSVEQKVEITIGTTGQVIDPGGVNHPKHYNNHPSGIETIEVKRQLSSNLGDAFKYVMRRDDKGTAKKDLNKALFYLRDERHHSKRGAIPTAGMLVSCNLFRIAKCEPVGEAREFYLALRNHITWVDASTEPWGSIEAMIDSVQRLLLTYKTYQD